MMKRPAIRVRLGALLAAGTLFAAGAALAAGALCMGCENKLITNLMKHKDEAEERKRGQTPGPVNVALSVSTVSEWEAALASIKADAVNTAFTLTVTADLGLPPQDLSAPAYNGKIVVVKGDTPTRTLSLASLGSLLTIGAAGTDLTLELQNIVAQGLAGNTAPLIKVNTGGTLAVKTGGKVTGNTYDTTVPDTGGGGVFVDGGTLNIAGGEISGNTVAGNSTAGAVQGGGILVLNGTMAMSGGSVKNNSLTNSNGSGACHASGGGIFLRNSGFTLSGGSIEGNTIAAVSTIFGPGSSNGGGVFIYIGSFVMTGGAIRDNHLSSTSVDNFGETHGGGVAVSGTGASFDMQGGEIYGNTGTYNLPNSGHPSGYEVCGAYGGGVFIEGGTMVKTGGVIYGSGASGSDANSIPYRNLIEDSVGPVTDGGQAVAYFAGTMKTAWRDTTVNTGDPLNWGN